MEFMLQNHVFPLFRSELGYMRARVSDHFPAGRPEFHVVILLIKVALNQHMLVILCQYFALIYIKQINLCFHTGLLGAALLL